MDQAVAMTNDDTALAFRSHQIDIKFEGLQSAIDTRKSVKTGA